MFAKASELIAMEKDAKKYMWGQFWAAHQRFFKYMCIASKVSYAVKVAQQAVTNDKCVVIGLQSTGQAQTQEAIKQTDSEQLKDFFSTAK